ncbi:MAG TPA: YlxR family protein [Clostridia bacterium]|nr:YlxR family protein [Clostridia bacterium]
MCVACRQMRPKKELMRIVRTPEGNVLIDKAGKLSGRGAYLCQNNECLEKAIDQNKLEKALRCSIPEDLLTDLTSKSVD